MEVETAKNSLIEYKGWHVVRKIGSGSFGSVYEIIREDFGYEYKAALKVISIPQSEQDLSRVKKNIGKSDDSLEVYYESVASEVVKEFELMYKLRGISNVVSYEDHEVRKHKDGIGWDILIRMELLTPLEAYMKNHPMKRKDVIQLGIDICKALERCGKYHIIHRDIKPGNIFVSEQGDFKLGDFGIARTIESHDAVLELSQKGTIPYMAPEVYKGSNYDFSVDLYSLGIVMYRLLNKDTLPFVPLPPSHPTFKDIELAKKKRLDGVPLPYPCEDDTQLADVVLKACSYQPEDRYQSPEMIRKHLEMILRGETIDVKAFEILDNDDATIAVFPSETEDGKTWASSNLSHSLTEKSLKETTEKQAEKLMASSSKAYLTKKILLLMLVIGAFIIVITIGVSVFLFRADFPQQGVDEIVIETEKGQNETATSNLQSLIEKRDFVSIYKIIQDSVKNGKNMDEDIQAFVYACEEELEYKRAVAAMKLLSDDMIANETFYKETIQWFCSRDKQQFARQIISDLREKGEEGAKLADEISLEYDVMNANEEEEKE